jgi:hypothetical protein
MLLYVPRIPTNCDYSTSITDTQVERIEEVGNEVFGARNERDEHKAVFSKKTGKYIGGIAFERNEYAEPVQGSGRAYTIGPTAQPHANLVAPARTVKNREGDNGELNDSQKMRKHISEVVL